ncbi:MAG: sugar phosphate isomerase/epimerase [Lachnospiraceae bacterium]|nr:sugar phosphate isomerase/epimerase [Lachnospiraceae bacterium]
MSKILNLEDLSSGAMCNSLWQVAKFANDLANTRKHLVYVVLHNTMHSSYYTHSSADSDAIINLFDGLMKAFPSVYYCIENVTPLSHQGILRNGLWISDIANICDWMNSRLCDKRVGVCFDLCHYETSCTFMSDATDQTCNEAWSDRIAPKLFDVCSEISAVGDLLWNVHVSSVVGLGDTKESHAYPLSKRDIPMLENLVASRVSPAGLSLYTMEVREDDYSKRLNAIESRKILEEVIRRSDAYGYNAEYVS